MADLDDLTSTESVKVIGSDATGLETKPVGTGYGDPDFGLRVSLAEFEDFAISAQKDPSGAGLVSQMDPIISAKFDIDLQTSVMEETNTGSGDTIHLSTGQASTSSGTTSGSSALFRTGSRVEYIPGLANYCQFTAAMVQPPTQGGSFIAVGPHTFPDASWNGFAIGYSGPNFGLFHLNNGSTIFTAQANFNEDPLDGSANSRFLDSTGVVTALDPTKGNLYRIIWLWHGYGPAYFQVQDERGIWRTFHKFSWVNNNITPHTSQSDLPFSLYVSNGGSTTNVTTYIASHSVGRLGKKSAKVTSNGDQQVIDASYQTGSTTAFSGTATTSVQSVPASPGNVITTAVIEAGSGVTQNDLLVSFDNGATFYTINEGDILEVDPVRGSITQLQLKTNSSTNNFKILLGRD